MLHLLSQHLGSQNPVRVVTSCKNMSMPITDVKKYDINRRIYLPKWVEEDLDLVPGECYVTFIQRGENIVIKKVSIIID